MKKILVAALAMMVLTLSGCKKPDYEGILRLHVIGNSNSAFDQRVKLKVKDRISVIMAERGIKTYEDAIDLARQERATITAIANEVLKENGADYSAAMDIGTYYFPEKAYGKAVFKEGNYNAVRLKLGKAEGENWWCVMFPPICFLDSGEGEWDFGLEERVEFKSLLAKIIAE